MRTAFGGMAVSILLVAQTGVIQAQPPAGGVRNDAVSFVLDDAAGGDADISGALRCRIGMRAYQRCSFVVHHEEARGSASLVVTSPNGHRRTILFENGRATGYEDGRGSRAAFSAIRVGQGTSVQIGRETYIVPDDLIHAG